MNSVAEAIASISQGGMAIIVDDIDAHCEGDLAMAAELVTPDDVAFYLSNTSGVIFTPIIGARADFLKLPLMVETNNGEVDSAFTVTVDYRHDTTTGISASDRAATIRALSNPTSRPADFNRPGHVLPIRYSPGGVLKRAGHSEATVDLCLAAGVQPVGVMSRILSHDKSEMAQLAELQQFATASNIPIVSVVDLIRYRRSREKLVRWISAQSIATHRGEFVAHTYESVIDGTLHIALMLGSVARESDLLVRVHSECLTGDVFKSLRCDCGPQLEESLELIVREGRGVLIYLRGHEGRGIGLGHKMNAYRLQEEGRDTVDANIELGLPVDSREYGVGAQMLVDLGVTSVRLLTNNPTKYEGLEGYGVEIMERVPLEPRPTKENIEYLRTKKERMGHMFDLRDDWGT